MRHQQPFILAMCDIDLFKDINDNFGHDAGDKALVEVTKVLSSMFRDSDVIGRLGGEEFAICLPQITIDEAVIACERLRISIEKMQINSGDNQFSLTISIGLVGLGDSETQNLAELLNYADQALYQAKENGRNQIAIYNQLERSQAELTNDNNLEICSEEKKLYPGINLSTGLSNVLGDENLFEQVLVMFYEDHREDENKLKEAIKQDDIATLKHLAHTLKGVASSIGAMDLFKKAKVLDEAVNSQQTQLFATLTENLGVELHKVTSGIYNNLKKHKLTL